MRWPDGVSPLPSDLFRWCWRYTCRERTSSGAAGFISPWPFWCRCKEPTLGGSQNRKHFIALRFRSRFWNRNCGGIAVVDRARCRGMGRTPQLVESARLTAGVHGINDGGRDTFRACDRRVSRRQTADDSETYCACTVTGAHHHRRPLWRMSLRWRREIIARGNAARWNRWRYRRFSRLRHQETSGERFACQ